MSGHNKWSKIKRKKELADAKKSQSFGKLARLIAGESKKARGDKSSPGLRGAIEKARSENMPLENIERAVAKGRADQGAELEQVVYETYGPGGVALVIEGTTSNKNRTAAEMKHLLGEYGLELSAPGSALWTFAKRGPDWVPNTTTELSDVDRKKLEAVVLALEAHDDIEQVHTNAK